MGGFGSGERLWKKRTAESGRTLDTATLRRWGMLATPRTRRGSFTWGTDSGGRPQAEVSYDLVVREADGLLRLRYAFPADPASASADYRVALVTTPCHLGGRRWWFLRPLVRGGHACRRRVRTLYLAGRYFGCRTCHDLTYTSTQPSDSRVYRAVRTGWGPDAPDGLEGRSVPELGFRLKVLTLQKTRAGRGSARGRRGQRRDE